MSEFWQSKTIYLKEVTGEKIVEEQERINAAKSMFVVATQIFPSNGKYDSFIYYKVNPAVLTHLDKDGKLSKTPIKEEAVEEAVEEIFSGDDF